MSLAQSGDTEASGADQPASIVVFHLEGDAKTESLRGELTEVMREKVAGSEDYQLVNDEPVVYSDVVVVLGCSGSDSTTQCLGRAAEHFGADLLLFGKIESEEGRNHASVRLFDPERGRYVKSFGRVLAGAEEPYPSFQREVESLLGIEGASARPSPGPDEEKPQRRRASLEVASEEPGAVVRIDGERVGETPVVADELEPGRYRVEVSREGHETWTEEVELKAGDETGLEARLREASDRGDEEEARASREATGPESPSSSPGGEQEETLPSSASRQGIAQWGPWAAVGAGGITMVAGILYGVRVKSTERELRSWRASNPSPSDQCVGRECELIDQGERAETANRVLLGIGGAATVGGVLWYVLQRVSGGEKRAEAEGIRVRPGLGSVTLSW